jgi:hypothetical protein
VISPEDGHTRLGKLLGLEHFAFPQPSSFDLDTAQEAARNKAEELEQEFEFRLFSAPSKRTADSSHVDSTNDGTCKIRLRIRSPSPRPTAPDEGKFIVPHRSWKYYFTTPALSSRQPMETADASPRREEYEDVAVSGTQLLDWSRRGSWVGCLFTVNLSNWSNMYRPRRIYQRDRDRSIPLLTIAAGLPRSMADNTFEAVSHESSISYGPGVQN